jgi:hypothetical protein
MKKLIAIIAVLVITMCAFGQKNHTNQKKTFTQSVNHRFSKHSREAQEKIHKMYVYRRQIGTTIYIRDDFDRFDRSHYEPCYKTVTYPDYYSTFGRGISFPYQHIVWFEEPTFPRYMNVEYIDPDDVIVFEGGSWMYLRDYYVLIIRPEKF